MLLAPRVAPRNLRRRAALRVRGPQCTRITRHADRSVVEENTPEVIDMNRLQPLLFVAALACAAVTACHTAPTSSQGKAEIIEKSDAAVERAKMHDMNFKNMCNDSVAYAVFPKVGKGAVGVGGAYGKGVLYEDGRPVGYCDLSQATVGAQLGGQTYTEIICFQDRESVDKFKKGKLAFDAQASAVALEAGASKNARYREGVAVYTTNEEGLMAEASIGGQKFTFEPL
jgi:lipid-binding SYLF domain-containing protein